MIVDLKSCEGCGSGIMTVYTFTPASKWCLKAKCLLFGAGVSAVKGGC